MKIRSIREVKNLAGKKVFLRADFNVPVAPNGKILDDYKIVAGLSTVRFLLRYGCKVIIATHLGEPLKSKKLEVRSKKFSVKFVAKRLGELLGKKIKFVSDCVGKKVEREVGKLKKEEILFLENLRFYKEEEENEENFAKKLAGLAEVYPAPFRQSLKNKSKKVPINKKIKLPERCGVYVNDAFAASHRNHASVSAIKKFLPSYAGLLLENEVVNLNKALKPKKPFVAVMGGAKIETKIVLLKKLKISADNILVGGALANNFLAAAGYEIGKSVASKEGIELAWKLKSKKIILPLDVIVDGKGGAKLKSADKVGKNEIILDIGPETIKNFSKFIKKARTIIWNGPMGKFEQNHFQHGTLAIARLIASRSRGSAFGIAGGGETIEALKKTEMLEYMDWVSTGGGAMLAFLAGEKMPGLEGVAK